LIVATVGAHKRILSVVAAIAALLALAATGCSARSAGASNQVTVVIGYQSKTINTVTAGTLLRARHYLEDRLAALGRQNGRHYSVQWQDYSTGAPITGEMVSGKIDIGSMGDYPMLINGSRSREFGSGPTSMISVTGYNPTGALNMIVVPPDSTATTLADLRGQRVSASVGSAGDGLLIRALQRAGIDPNNGVQAMNQQPAVGASGLTSGSIAALAQFPAWPGQLVFDNKAKLLYDGASLRLPTLHGVVVRNAYAKAYPEVIKAFLAAQVDATNYLHQHPLAAAKVVAAATGLPPEVVYLYNGPNGMVTFDPTIKPMQRAALATDAPFLRSLGIVKQLNLPSFIDDSYLKKVVGRSYGRDVAETTNPSRITETDPTCGPRRDDPKRAGEVWLAGEQATRAEPTPVCLLRRVRDAEAAGKKVRAAYIPDAASGTRWYADKCVWVDDPARTRDQRFLPFDTRSGATAYLAKHPGSHITSYSTAVASA
jgi:NitT/TauT family transport system substrate-binding protein